MRDAARLLLRSIGRAVRRHPGRALAVAAVVAGSGVGLAFGAPSVTRTLSPPAGPPDTLRNTRLPVPRTAELIETPYLKAAVEEKSAEERRFDELRARYNVTETLARLIWDVAMEHGIDPELAFRLIRVESVFDEDAIGAGGALGLCQLMPGTARDIDPSLKTHKEMLEPRTNLRLGFTNLRAMIERYDGDVRLGVIAYNRGEIAVDRALRNGRDPENGYGKRVLGPRAHGGKSYQGPGLVEKTAAGDSTATGTETGAAP